MADEIKQLLDMVSSLKNNVNDGFEKMNRKFDEMDDRKEKMDDKNQLFLIFFNFYALFSLLCRLQETNEYRYPFLRNDIDQYKHSTF